MKFYKISNLVNRFGQYDYKDLDIDKFIAGSQVYSEDDSICLIATTEENPLAHVDLIELTEAEYTTKRQEIENKRAQIKLTLEGELAHVKNSQAQIQAVIDEIIMNGGVI